MCVCVSIHQSAIGGTTGTYPSLDVNRDKQPSQHNHENQGLKPKKKWSQIMLPGGPPATAEQLPSGFSLGSEDNSLQDHQGGRGPREC